MFRAGTTAPMLGAKFWPKQHAERMKFLKHFQYQLSCDLIMEPFWEANRNGFMVDGVRLVLYFPCFSCDLLEAWTMSSRKGNGMNCHLKLDKVPKTSYSDHNMYTEGALPPCTLPQCKNHV